MCVSRTVGIKINRIKYTRIQIQIQTPLVERNKKSGPVPTFGFLPPGGRTNTLGCQGTRQI
jgi:hypothetical protein